MTKRRLIKISGLSISAYFLIIYIVAVFSHPPLVGMSVLPLHLKNKKHIDYTLPGTKWIPWSLTSWRSVGPPRMLFGNQTQTAQTTDGQVGPAPIPEPGTYQFSIVLVKKGWPLILPYFAVTTKNKVHFRIGRR